MEGEEEIHHLCWISGVLLHFFVSSLDKTSFKLCFSWLSFLEGWLSELPVIGFKFCGHTMTAPTTDI